MLPRCLLQPSGALHRVLLCYYVHYLHDTHYLRHWSAHQGLGLMLHPTR